jgi:histone-lysine N-methyltransferase SETD3
LFKSIFPIIQELRGSDFKYQRSEDQLKVFIRWLEQNDIKMDRLNIKQSVNDNAGWGVWSECEIPKDSVLVDIPFRVMLSTVITDPKLAELISMDPLLQAVPNFVLILRIIQERLNPHSFWKPYLDSLPSEFNLPMFYSPDEVDDLKGLSVQCTE